MFIGVLLEFVTLIFARMEENWQQVVYKKRKSVHIGINFAVYF
jgi:hypothetical protein